MRNEVTFMRSQLTAEQQAKLALEDQLTSEMQVSSAISACLVLYANCHCILGIIVLRTDGIMNYLICRFMVFCFRPCVVCICTVPVLTCYLECRIQSAM
jgi:hypothetical protein